MRDKKTTKAKKAPQQSVFAEAWQNMSADMDNLLPQKLRGRKDKKKFGLALAIIELVVLGVIGKFVYDWLVN